MPESPEARLLLLHAGEENEIHIFVHGYSALSDEAALKTLLSYIARACPQGHVYLMYWQSGNWRAPAARSVARLANWAMRGLQNSSFKPEELLGELLQTAEHQIDQYTQSRDQAIATGKGLQQLLQDVPHVHEMPIHFIAHSLGARVIFEALSKQDWSCYELGDVILLGGAVDARDGGWKACAQKVRRIHNVWSKQDKALRLLPRGNHRIGRRELEIPQQEVNNTELRIGHTDYWPNLGTILPTVWPDFKPAAGLLSSEE